MALDRDQVLHVARLARLEVSEEEIEKFAGELSKVLDHIETIDQLDDLDDAEPTSHVVNVENALRADEPKPSLPQDVALSGAPDRRPTAGSACRARRRGATRRERAARADRGPGGGEGPRGRAWSPGRCGAPGASARPATTSTPSRGWRGRSRPRWSAAPRWPACPIAIKDLFATQGVPSQAGSKILEGYLPPYSATVVEHLTGAGAPLLGKTNQDEFAMGSSTEHSAYGPTLNPWDRARVPGGSSGGSAAAVAAGTAPWAIGTDTGGSIRQPAALCGIVGMKPTYGAVSRYGMIAFASSLDQAGPFTRDVTDAALLLSAMVGRDPRDSTSLGPPRADRAPDRDRPHGRPDRRPGGADRRGHRGRRPEGVRGDARASPASSARPSRRCSSRTRRTRWPPTTSSPPPRPRPTWPATTASATASAPRRPTC